MIVAGIGYTSYLLFGHQGIDSLTVSDLKSHAESLHNQQLEVEGKVTPGSINWNSQDQILRFVLTDDKESLHVIYKGIVPDDFKPGAELVVVGKYHPDDVFEALSFDSRRSFCTFCH